MNLSDPVLYIVFLSYKRGLILFQKVCNSHQFVAFPHFTWLNFPISQRVKWTCHILLLLCLRFWSLGCMTSRVFRWVLAMYKTTHLITTTDIALTTCKPFLVRFHAWVSDDSLEYKRFTLSWHYRFRFLTVIILKSVFFGMYLFTDLVLLDPAAW